MILRPPPHPSGSSAVVFLRKRQREGVGEVTARSAVDRVQRTGDSALDLEGSAAALAQGAG